MNRHQRVEWYRTPGASAVCGELNLPSPLFNRVMRIRSCNYICYPDQNEALDVQLTEDIPDVQIEVKQGIVGQSPVACHTQVDHIPCKAFVVMVPAALKRRQVVLTGQHAVRNIFRNTLTGTA